METNQGYKYRHLQHYHRTISSTDLQAHLYKDYSLAPGPVQFFNDHCVMKFLEGEKEVGEGVK